MKKEYPDIKFAICDVTGHNIVEKMKVDGSWEFLLR
jgi:hypothetical protein